jgi:GT2 family glycosyltransferase
MPNTPQEPDVPVVQPTVSLIILNWNGEKFLTRCLEAVSAQTFLDYEVLVVDNGSTDASMEYFEERWKHFKALRLDENMGFARGNNNGAQHASGRWLAFLNNDAFPEPEWLANLVNAADKHGRYSFVSSLMIEADNPNLIQDSGDIYHISGLAWPRDNNHSLKQALLESCEVFSASAAAALYEREAFLEAGGFSEHFSSHFEDVDLGFRLRLRGYRCLFAPDAVVHHLGSASYGRESDRTVYQVQRNLVWCYFVNMPGWLFWKYLPAHFLANLLMLVYYTLRGQGKVALKAKRDAVRGLPRMMEKRRIIQSQRKATLEEIDRALDHSLFGPFLRGKRARAAQRLVRRFIRGESGK